MILGRFIVVKQGHKITDYIDKDLERGKNWIPIAYAMSGQIVFTIGATVPVIQEGVGCIGTGVISELWTDGNASMITFKYVASDKNDPFNKAMYSLYNLQGAKLSGGANDGGSTFILPGLGGATNANSSKGAKATTNKPEKSYGKRSITEELYDDDNDDLGDFYDHWSMRNDAGF